MLRAGGVLRPRGGPWGVRGWSVPNRIMTQRTLFPILLVGLPIGLAVSVVVALYLYYNPLDIPLPSRPERPSAASLLRRSPNENDLRDYRRLLTTDLALTPSADPARQRAAANWIASTLGPSNLGLSVQELALAPEGGTDPASVATAPTLVIELPGTRRKDEAILVMTGYHAEAPGLDGAVSTSTLMSVAGAFAGTPQRRGLVFAFVPGEGADAGGHVPLDALVQSLKVRDLTVRGILDLRVAAAPAPPSRSGAPAARATAASPRAGLSWTSEVRESFAPRKPAGLSLEFVDPADAPPAAAALAGWRAAPAPYVLVHLTPAAANDETSPLALARSLEGVLQALANQ